VGLTWCEKIIKVDVNLTLLGAAIFANVRFVGALRHQTQRVPATAGHSVAPRLLVVPQGGAFARATELVVARQPQGFESDRAQ
jgi:hypothetical protein